MPTKKYRLNIPLESDEVDMLTILSKKRKQSVAGLAKELILDAIDRQEDMELSTLAQNRLKEAKKKRQKTISHENAWK